MVYRCRIKMMLYCEFLQAYIVISKSIVVKEFKWVLMIQTAIKICVLWWAGACHLVLFFKEEQVLWCYEGVKWLLSFKGTLIKQSIGFCMWCDPKSYDKYYVHFCVPWILEVISNYPRVATTNDCICCLYWLSVCVGICSIHRSWFLWGLVGCWALLLHL